MTVEIRNATYQDKTPNYKPQAANKFQAPITICPSGKNFPWNDYLEFEISEIVPYSEFGAYPYAANLLLINSAIFLMDAPGMNTSATPISFSFATSAGEMIPPTSTILSPAPFVFKF